MTWEQQLVALAIGTFSAGVLAYAGVEAGVRRIVRRRRRRQLEQHVRRRLEVRNATVLVPDPSEDPLLAVLRVLRETKTRVADERSRGGRA